MSQFRKYGRYLIYLLLPAFFVLIVNSSVNRHNHLVQGYIYTHAHPYQKDMPGAPAQSHSHSALELAILDLLSNFEVIVLPIVVFLFFLVMLFLPAVRKLSGYLPLPEVYSMPPRPPPVFISA